jgi:thiol peroxidase
MMLMTPPVLARRATLAVAAFAVFFVLPACATTGAGQDSAAAFAVGKFPVAKGTAVPGTTVERKGTVVKLFPGKLAVDDKLSSAPLVSSDWKPYAFAADGVVKIVSIVPSVDTKVCEEQTHVLGENQGIDARVKRITLSRDLPAAQARFAKEAKLENVTYLSDYKGGAFGRSVGLLMEDSELLARAVLVVDGAGKVRHLQVVPDVTQLPDMEAAIQVANGLVR